MTKQIKFHQVYRNVEHLESKININIFQSLHTLTDGYIKTLIDTSNHNLIPIDIIKLIAKYYDINRIASLIVVTPNAPSADILDICNTNITHRVLGIKQAINNWGIQYCNRPKQHIVNKCVLPKYLDDQIFALRQDNLPTNEWNLIFQFSNNFKAHACNIMAIHPSYSMKQYYDVISLDLPPIQSSSCVYNRNKQQLYAFNEYNQYMFALNLNQSSEYIKWNIIESQLNFSFKTVLTSCMVDNDRFISCIGFDTYDSYLYGLNCNKSIKLGNI
eukprot:373559_1